MAIAVAHDRRTAMSAQMNVHKLGFVGLSFRH